MDSQTILLATGIGSGWLIVGYGVRMLIRGGLHPQATIDRMVAEHSRVVEDIGHDRDEWRAAHRISETARQVAADQVAELLEHARTTDKFIRSLPYPTDKGQ